MRFIAIFKPDELVQPTQQMIEQMNEFIREAVSKGVLIATEGFGPSTQADVKIRRKKGKFTVTDGPFSESKELIGGFALMQVNSREEVIEWTRRFLAIAEDGEAEVRQLFDMSPIQMATGK